MVGSTWTLGEVWERGLLLSPGNSAGKESTYNAGDPSSYSWVGKIPWRKDRLPIPVFLGFPGGSAGKESSCNAGDLSSIPGFGRFPGEGNSYSLQDSGLENSMDCIVHGVAKSQTQLSVFTFKPIVRSALQLLCTSRDCCSPAFSKFCLMK